MRNLRKWGATLGAGAVLLTLAGCADKDGSGQAESPADANNLGGAVADNLGDTANAASGAVKGAANAVTGAAGAVGNTVTGAVDATGNAIENAAPVVGNAAENAATTVGNAGETAAMTSKVKTAIGANAGLKGTRIDVDTMAGKNNISLQGTVKTAAQKNLATAVAKKAAPGYNIKNMLKVGAM